MSDCCMENCIYWTGQGCACEVMNIATELFDEKES